ncbi:MBL fold metallo-hydrolase [Hymenobacter lutimineralis]|uniref:MBL fold metallo-hydrolase n=1 Tax=Hymenobacter lutimineralis TaxID=2606448 RepID=A0A5D6VHZ2_9BACT|nr:MULTISPECIES: MBL fold metallo-hydrolase [Hymenobacter]QIX60169.1 MBL fold metallo-hydrolase [Hymenobacter sp. BT18]TYZ14409.1 MBL fold metallo-hydrolase [Hymenobacter lutimineralis]
MQITFLGTGTSQGVPVIGCPCAVCRSLDYRDKRLRVSVHLQVQGKSIIIDSGPDFRQQALREYIQHLDALVFTHEHKDHTAGLDDIRAYNFRQQQDMPVYAEPRVLEQLKQEYAYIFAEHRYPGIPQVQLQPILSDTETFLVEGVPFEPIRALHYKLPVLGFRVGNFTYVTDANYLSPEALEQMRGSEVIVLNALRHEKHISHFTLQEAVDILTDLAPKRAYLTHISHQLGRHREVEATLPSFIRLAYDGLRLAL